MNQDKTVVLQTFSDIMDAQNMKARLMEKGIESFLRNENVLGLDPIAGIELKIFEKDREAALKVIES
jgi:hypothetical protein